MNRIVRSFAIAIAAIVIFISGRAEAGTCKLSIMLDRSGSMKTVRSSDGLTRCQVATQGVIDALNAYALGDLYEVNTGRIFSSNDDYDTNCPDPANRLVSIWAFEDSQIVHLTNGFVPIAMAPGILENSSFFQNNNGSFVPKECVFGATPLAQGMCESARDFPAGVPPAGEIRHAIVLTDGDENFSDQVPLSDQGLRCRAPGDPAQPDLTNPNGWAQHVKNEYASRGVVATGFLYDGGVVSASVASARVRETVPGISGLQALALGDRGYPVSADITFFQSLATQTGGSFAKALDTAPVASDPSLIDSDGDGIPDYRDLCDAPGCIDNDHDGIPDVVDQCLFSREDGNGPNPGDGCPDGDADGIPNDRDQCLTKREDYLPPKPTDGCPIPAVAAPAAPATYLGLLALTMLGCGFLALRKLRPRTLVVN